MGILETKEAIEAAQTAFKTWSRTTARVRILRSFNKISINRGYLQHRYGILKRLHALMLEHNDDLSLLMVCWWTSLSLRVTDRICSIQTLENGKTITESKV